MITKDRRLELTVNAVNGETAVNLAIGAAGDISFLDPGEISEDESIDPARELELRSISKLGGYQLTVIRKSFLSDRSGGEYDAEYGIEDFSGPHPCFESPDLQDTSSQYVSELNAQEIAKNTRKTRAVNSKKRL